MDYNDQATGGVQGTGRAPVGKIHSGIQGGGGGSAHGSAFSRQGLRPDWPRPNEMFEDVTIQRPNPGSYDADGRWMAPATNSFVTRASVQPMTSDELLLLPEGARTRGAVKLYCLDELQAGDERVMQLPDRLSWRGDLWEVHQVDTHRMRLLAHFYAVAIRVER